MSRCVVCRSIPMIRFDMNLQELIPAETFKTFDTFMRLALLMDTLYVPLDGGSVGSLERTLVTGILIILVEQFYMFNQIPVFGCLVITNITLNLLNLMVLLTRVI